MANPQHVAKLKEGVAAWNAWRRAFPHVKPDLRDVNFTDVKAFSGTPLWAPHELWSFDAKRKVERTGVVLDGVDFSDADLTEADLSSVRLANASLRNARCEWARFRNAWLKTADLSNAQLRYADFYDANLAEASLNGARLFRANLSRVYFRDTDLTHANLQYANMDEALVTNVRYRRGAMRLCYLGIQGAATMHGDAQFRRDAQDQDFIDTKINRWTTPSWNPKRFLLLWPWALIDYGRSLWRILAIAALIIVGFGFAIDAMIAGGRLAYTGNQGIENWFTPFYTSGVAFSTLGFTDLVKAQSLGGQVLLMSEVLLGYMTLGLLLAILANGAARRS